ncbi:MAG: OmpA family protein [Candidatus Krumholzibacteriia bacterium]
MRHPRTWLTITVLAASLLARAAGAADFVEKRFYVTPMLGWTFFDSDRLFQSGQPLNDDVYFGGRAGIRLTDLLWFDLAGGYTGTKDCADCTESWTHYSGNLMLSRATRNTVNPFISLGAGWSKSKHAVLPDESAAAFEAAVGLRVRLNDVLGIRIEARNVLTRADAGWSKSHIDDVIVGAGLTIGFGGSRQEIESDADSRAATVFDGDADNDGVPDSRDKCPDTERGCVVDESGCPIDSDRDGICDGLDRCPLTPTLVKVDEFGCPVVVDVKHLETELLDTGKIRIANVNFDYDKSTIRPDAYAVLDTVGRVLTKWPGLNIEIDAYTDSRGTEAYNYGLSHRRAESVREYLLAHFPQFQPTQLTSKDYGEMDPLVPNTTAANMQENRRVEFTVLNKEQLKRQQ